MFTTSPLPSPSIPSSPCPSYKANRTPSSPHTRFSRNLAIELPTSPLSAQSPSAPSSYGRRLTYDEPPTPSTPLSPRLSRPPSAVISIRRKPVPSFDGEATEFGVHSPTVHSPVFSLPSPGTRSHRPSHSYTYTRSSTDLSNLYISNGASQSVQSLGAALGAPFAQSRPHVLPVDPPSSHVHIPVQTSPSYPGSRDSHASSLEVHTPITAHSQHSQVHLLGLPRYSAEEVERRRRSMPALAFGVEPNMEEMLPVYDKESGTEPKTLAAWLWWWGIAFMPFWFVGMFILWSPLRFEFDEEDDCDKHQTVEEMLAIVRATELKYAKRCAWGMLGWLVVIVITGIVVVAVVVSK